VDALEVAHAFGGQLSRVHDHGRGRRGVGRPRALEGSDRVELDAEGVSGGSLVLADDGALGREQLPRLGDQCVDVGEGLARHGRLSVHGDADAGHAQPARIGGEEGG
jgi:hypothetical protein